MKKSIKKLFYEKYCKTCYHFIFGKCVGMKNSKEEIKECKLMEDINGKTN